MTDINDAYPYLVTGDGIVADSTIIKSLMIIGRTKYPVPVMRRAKTLEDAKKFAKDMIPWNKEIIISKLIEVIGNIDES